MKKLFLAFLFTSSLGYSTIDAQEKRLPQDELVAILVDLALAKATICQDPEKPTPLELELFREKMLVIYQTYEIDIALFERSYLPYLADYEKAISLYDAVIKALEELD